MNASVHRGPTVDLQRFANENRGATASSLVAGGQSWVPEAMPTRLASHELKTLEAWAKVAVLLNQEYHSRLVQGMKKGGAAAADIKGGDKVRSNSAQPSGRQPDEREMGWGGGQSRRREGGAGARWRGSRPGGIPRQRVFRPDIVVADRGSGVRQMALCPRAYRMNTEGAMNPETHLVYGRSGGYLQGTSPLRSI